jgi:diaminohydroxyphosphoribosylaminopyrimidine deaminase/5-amino-6-(5-phosphoribosylamino)uracil reductase
MRQADEMYMRRALELAQKGKYTTSPNPRVGAVIVYQNQIIGEGFHREYGKEHAEIDALNQVTQPELLKDSTIYVSLEPCSHFGKTPPCSDAIIQQGIPRVVIANSDPFEQVNGSGIDKLRKAGISVETGILEHEGKYVNRRFFTFHEQKRPYIILKWAQTLDGFIGRAKNDPGDSWITSPLSKQLVHQWRAEEDAILVGKNTVLKDNPQLNCREFPGKNPIRIIIDPNNELETHWAVFNREAPTLILNNSKEVKEKHIEWIKVDFNKFTHDFNQLCVNRKLQSVLVEGGAFTLEQFISASNWDEARVFTGNNYFKKGIKAPSITAAIHSKETIGGDLLLHYLNKGA